MFDAPRAAQRGDVFMTPVGHVLTLGEARGLVWVAPLVKRDGARMRSDVSLAVEDLAGMPQVASRYVVDAARAHEMPDGERIRVGQATPEACSRVERAMRREQEARRFESVFTAAREMERVWG